ncbi:outer membrane lipoprotein carrier protein LolA [Marinomonas agarivorans]|nr:outer membrane lipoprotein carrier protein LolA [Marinomonas agarivorans]
MAACLFAIGFGFSANGVSANDADQLADLLQSNRNIAGDFEQITYDETGFEQQKSQGTFILAQPNRFVWETELPFPQKIVSDGDNITIWDIDLEQASQKSFANTLGNSPAALLSRPANEVLPHYNVTQFGQVGAEQIRFELIPNNDEGLFANLVLSFKNTSIHTMKIQDTLGQTTVIRFANLEHHQGADLARFKLVLPDYVDLIIEGQ